MKKEYKPLFESFTFSNGTKLKNRFVLAPLTHTSSNDDGTISEEELPYIENLSKDVGLSMCAATYVSDNGKAYPRQASIAHDKFIPGLKRQAQVMKKNGAKAIMQLQHGGNQCSSDIAFGGEVLAPSNVKKEGMEEPRALTHEEIEQIIHDFGQSTRRAVEAGFDGVEIHGANHYLIQQFFSPHFNIREDQWGERIKFPLAVIDEVIKVAKEHGNKEFIVGYRFSPEEPESNGITMKETFELIDAIVQKPLDYLHVSLMDIQSTVREGADPNSRRIDLIRDRVNGLIPIIGIGSIYTGKDAIEAEKTGVELIALGRELLIDSDFVLKLKEGREDEVISKIDPNREDRHGMTEPLWKNILDADWLPMEGKNDEGTKFLA